MMAAKSKPLTVDEIDPTGPGENFLWVGLTADGREVVIHHPRLLTDERGVGHIIFSPDQARGLAKLLNKHALDADRSRE